jgi:hypothetical protein
VDLRSRGWSWFDTLAAVMLVLVLFVLPLLAALGVFDD